jgi:hypothetical protein
MLFQKNVSSDECKLSEIVQIVSNVYFVFTLNIPSHSVPKSMNSIPGPIGIRVAEQLKDPTVKS